MKKVSYGLLGIDSVNVSKWMKKPVVWEFSSGLTVVETYLI
jgi:hypothetical protein